MSINVDYNKFANSYEKRYEKNNLLGIYGKLNELANNNSYKYILEIGCGTGYWLNLLNKSDRLLFGCDLSEGMLRQGIKTNPNIYYFSCDADQLSISRSIFDLIYCVNVLHFIDDKREFIKNVKSLLRPGGTFAVISIDPSFNDDSWYIYNFFPGLYSKDINRFLPWNDLREYFNLSGFKNIESEIIENVESKHVGSDVLKDYFLKKESSSHLASMNKLEYENGISEIKKTIDKDPGHIFKTKISFGITYGKNI